MCRLANSPDKTFLLGLRASFHCPCFYTLFYSSHHRPTVVIGISSEASAGGLLFTYSQDPASFTASRENVELGILGRRSRSGRPATNKNPTFRSRDDNDHQDQPTEWTNLIMRQMIVSFAIELAHFSTSLPLSFTPCPEHAGQHSKQETSLWVGGHWSVRKWREKLSSATELMEDFLKSNSINVVKWHFNCLSSNQILIISLLCHPVLNFWLTSNCYSSFSSPSLAGNYKHSYILSWRVHFNPLLRLMFILIINIFSKGFLECPLTNE